MERDALSSRTTERPLQLALVRETGLHEAFEKRMRLVRLALEFRMILAGQEVRVIPQLDQLRERPIR